VTGLARITGALVSLMIVLDLVLGCVLSVRIYLYYHPARRPGCAACVPAPGSGPAREFAGGRVVQAGP
jgi:hypothetical protein